MNSQKTGFTLLELVISVGIIGIISVVISQAFLLTTRSNTKVEIAKEVKQNGDYALGIMERMIRSAQTVASACTGIETTTLSIVGPDSATTTFACDGTTGSVRIASTSGSSTVYLTNTSVSLGTSCAASTLKFICKTVAGSPNSVKINFTLSQNSAAVGQSQQSSLSFQTSVTLRK